IELLGSLKFLTDYSLNLCPTFPQISFSFIKTQDAFAKPPL
ncbi:14241_t:CDS:1, partial [Entrophospora sp. SA101]